MLDDGTVAKITEKWMYADMTKINPEIRKVRKIKTYGNRNTVG